MDRIEKLFRPNKLVDKKQLTMLLGPVRRDVTDVYRIKYNLLNMYDNNPRKVIDGDLVHPQLAIQMIKSRTRYDVTRLTKQYGRADVPDFFTTKNAPVVLAYIDSWESNFRQPIFVLQPDKKWYISLFDAIYMAHSPGKLAIRDTFAKAQEYKNLFGDKVKHQLIPGGER